MYMICYIGNSACIAPETHIPGTSNVTSATQHVPHKAEEGNRAPRLVKCTTSITGAYHFPSKKRLTSRVGHSKRTGRMRWHPVLPQSCYGMMSGFSLMRSKLLLVDGDDAVCVSVHA